MNSRQLKIIELLILSKEPITLAELTDRFDIGLRTIQNDISNINFEFKKLGLHPLSNKYGIGLILVKKDKERKELTDLLHLKSRIVVLNNDERMEAIYKIFLFSPGYVTINELADRLDVSRGTILNDLKRLRKELEPFQINLSTMESKGNKLSGNEMSIREFAVRKYLEKVKASCLYSAEEYHKQSISNRFFPVRSFEETSYIYSELQIANESLKKYMTGNAFLHIISNLEIAIERIRNGRSVCITTLQMESLYGTQEFKVMYDLAMTLSKHLVVEFPQEEAAYLALLTIGSDMVHAGMDINTENFADIQMLVCNLISRVEENLRIDFSQDVTLYSDLVFHIRPAIYRIKNNIRQSNFLYEDIRKSYLEIFEAVKKSVNIIEEQTRTQMSDDEIGFIAVHFASVYEKQKRRKMTTPNVLVVCDSGIGTSNLLAARLTTLYDINIADIIAFYAIKQTLSWRDVDYIVSTLDLDFDFGEKPVLRVSPMLTDRDTVMLDRYFNKRQVNKVDENEFMEVIERSCTIHNRDQLMEDLTREYSSIFKLNKRKDIYEKMLIDVMSKEMIQLDYEALDWEDAVRRSGKLLMDGGCIEQKYIDSMVSTVKKMGSYIVIAKGIALPHSRSGEFAQKVGISFLRLKTPVEFGHPENDPVDLLFGLSSVDNKEHLRALRDLTKILTNEGNVHFMREAGTAEEVCSFLNRFS